ncbi:MAG: hypothetical protein WBA74_15190 [Cyclobacteriaceae bacterium]
MKLILRIILIAGIGFFASAMTDWWALVPVTFLISFFLYGNNFATFLSGFLGGGLLWMGYSWKIDTETSQIMSEKITLLLTLSDSLFVILIAGAIGALLGGFSAVSGNSLRLIFVKKKKSGLYH